jgi:hypothetical protein
MGTKACTCGPMPVDCYQRVDGLKVGLVGYDELYAALSITPLACSPTRNVAEIIEWLTS